MSHAAPQQNRIPNTDPAAGADLDPLQGAPVQGHSGHDDAAAAQHAQPLPMGDGSQAQANAPRWPKPGDPDYEQFLANQQRQERGPRQKQIIRFRHWMGQRVVGFAAFLEGANNEQVAQRMQAYWESREAARAEADNRRGFLRRGGRWLASIAIGTPGAIGRGLTYGMYGPGEGRGNGPWNFADPAPAAEAAPRRRTQRVDEHRQPLTEPRQPVARRIRDLPRDTRSPLTSAAERAAGRGARRRNGAEHDRRDGQGQADQGDNRERRSEGDIIDTRAMARAAWEYRNLPQEQQEANDMQQWVANRAAALVIAVSEYGKLSQAEQEANDMQQWVANRAGILPRTEWGNIAVARKTQQLLGNTEQGYETVAWNELSAEPFLLRAGMSPAAWVEARAAWLKHQAIAGDEQLAQVRAEARRTAEESEARRREEREYERKVAAHAQPIANLLHAALRTPDLRIDPAMDGNRIRRARERAEEILSEIIAAREKRNLPNPFQDPRFSASQNTQYFLRAIKALTYVIAERGLTTRKVNSSEAEAKIVSDATFRAAEREVFGQL